jgi:endogenous inhibitor of DNA gyrase (YacG/DUF329 family)
MIKVKCPHCGASGSINPPPREFIIIAPCPQCGELVVLFREKVAAINRKILTEGTFEEKKQHIAEIITTFLDSVGSLPPALFDGEGAMASMIDLGAMTESDSPESDRGSSITKEEISDFINIDLKLIDKKEYFEQVFGKLD